MEELFNQIDTLGITVNRRPKGRLRKMESQTIEKIGCVIPILIKKIEGEEEK